MASSFLRTKMSGTKDSNVIAKHVRCVMLQFACTTNGLIIRSIDNYVKDDIPRGSDSVVVFTMSLCTLESKQMLISLLFQLIWL